MSDDRMRRNPPQVPQLLPVVQRALSVPPRPGALSVPPRPGAVPVTPNPVAVPVTPNPVAPHHELTTVQAPPAAAPPQYMVYADETEYGPIDEKELRLWAYEERIKPGTPVRLSTSHEWGQASSFSLTFPSQQTLEQQPTQIVINNHASVTSHKTGYHYSEHHSGGTNNGVAAICSFLLPGLGQFVQGRPGAGAAYLIGAIVSLMLVVVAIGLILYPAICLMSIIDAAVYKPPRRNRRRY